MAALIVTKFTLEKIHRLGSLNNICTPKKLTAKAPENRWLENYLTTFILGWLIFRDDLLVSGRVHEFYFTKLYFPQIKKVDTKPRLKELPPNKRGLILSVDIFSFSHHLQTGLQKDEGIWWKIPKGEPFWSG